jgi:LuxR family maltose regulon positive regulatory protein
MKRSYNTRNTYFPRRITDAMKEVLNYPLTIVEAPMGYGKTTAVRKYLDNHASKVMWHNIYDNTSTGFWNGFCRQLDTLDHNCAQSLVRLGFPDDSVSIHEALHIISAIDFPKQSVMVIDDYHLAGGAEVNAFIESVVRNEISNLHIVLAARYIEIANIEELELKGYLNHLKKEMFELSPKEIVEYFRLCGVVIRDSDAERLHVLTEGWISAIYLLMLNYVATGCYSDITNIYKLMEKAVYNPLSEEIKDFLVVMCIFDNFTAEQAVFMWGEENTAGILGEIMSKNAFIKYDSRQKTYHMHAILTNLLKDVLEGKSIKDDLYRKAAEWYLRNCDFTQSMHYSYLCGDFEGILKAIEREKAININPPYRKELVVKYFTECPDDVKAKNHFVMLLFAFRLFTFNELALFKIACEEFVRNINNDISMNENVRSRLMGEFEMVLSIAGYNDIGRMAEHHQKAGRLLKEPSSIMYANSIWTFGSPSVLYMFYRESGKLSEHIKTIMEDIPFYSRLSNGNAAGGEYVMYAESHFSAGDYDNAEIAAYQALCEAQSKNQVANIICVLFLKMRISLARGDFVGAAGYLKSMHDELEREKEYTLIHTVEICEGYLYALLGKSDKVPIWLANGNFVSYRLLFPMMPMIHIVYGRTLLINGEYLKLVGSSRHFTAIASVFPNLLALIYTDIYLAAANYRIFREEAALDALKQALVTALPDRMYMPFVENCDYIKPLLEKLSKEGFQRDGISKILELMEPYKTSLDQIIKENFSVNSPGLTDRETEIAKLAAEGYSNREIGNRLYISENTVKTQMKSVFEKLNISSRVLLKHFFQQ